MPVEGNKLSIRLAHHTGISANCKRDRLTRKNRVAAPASSGRLAL